MIDWRLRVLGLLAATLALAVPASASGAVTIGSNLEGAAGNATGCGANPCTVAQQALPASATASGGLVAPSNGVVVRWRIKVGGVTTPVALRVIRQPEPLSQAKTGAGTGPTATPPTNQTTPYDVRLPILAGDAVGIDCCAPTQPLLGFEGFSSSSGASVSRWNPPALVDNAPPRDANFTLSNFQLLVQADIEPDADGDAFGDETQDQCPGQMGPESGCPPDDGSPPPDDGSPPPDEANDFSFGKVKRNKRKGSAKLTVNVPGGGELELAKTTKVKPDEDLAEAAGKEKLSIKPRGKAKKKLNAKGKAKVKAEVTFAPNGGTPNTEDKKIKLVKR
jgi:hypothetical protein